MCLVIISDAVQRTNLFDDMVIELAQGGPACSSWRNLLTHSNKYREFCNILSVIPFPITEQNLCRYMAYLTFSLTSSESVMNYVSGLKKLHAYARVPFPAWTPYVSTVFQGVKRLLAHQVQQSRPITPEILKRIAMHVNKHDPNQVVKFTALVLGFYLFLRSSNLTCKTQTTFDPNKNLTRSDIRLAETIALIEIRWSKTIQFCQRKLLMPIIQILDADICPIIWLKLMINMVPASPHHPAFCVYNAAGKLVPLTYRPLLEQLKKWITLINLPPQYFSLHGLRRGGATFAFESNLATQSIMVIGDWASDSFRRYIDQSLETRLRAMTQISEHLQSDSL